MDLRRRTGVLCTLALVLVLGASGCPQQSSNQGGGGNPRSRKPHTLNCDSTIAVDVNYGAYPLVAFLCEDDTITFDGKGHQFQVQFDTGSPFTNNQTAFSNSSPSGTVKHTYQKLELYKYTITVDSTHVFDPQVVGGGNP